MTWAIAELKGEGRDQRWERRAESFDSLAQADQWIRTQPNGQRMEAREIEDGIDEAAAAAT